MSRAFASASSQDITVGAAGSFNAPHTTRIASFGGVFKVSDAEAVALHAFMGSTINTGERGHCLERDNLGGVTEDHALFGTVSKGAGGVYSSGLYKDGTITDAEWHALVCALDASTADLYKDGAALSATQYGVGGTQAGDQTGALRIGSVAGTFYLNGGAARVFEMSAKLNTKQNAYVGAGLDPRGLGSVLNSLTMFADMIRGARLGWPGPGKFTWTPSASAPTEADHPSRIFRRKRMF